MKEKTTLKYLQIAETLRSRIQRGELQTGDRMPSFAELRTQHNVTLSTVERVYGVLENEGLIERRHGSGTYVAEPVDMRTGNLGFVGQSFGAKRRNPFNVPIIEGVQQETEKRGQHLLYMGTDYSLDLSACAKMDGVLICNIEDTAAVANRLPVLMPRVSMLIVADKMPSVVADDYRGAKKATRYLLDLGHRHIACLMEERPSISKRRFAGYKDAMQEAGVEIDPRLVRIAKEEAKPMGTDLPYLKWAKWQMQKWLRKDWKESHCTAIVVQNEVAAIGVIQVLQEEGIHVPTDVSVIGFDGTELCDLLTPQLTAMQLPLSKIGRAAVELLNRQIDEEEIGEEVISLPMTLKEGGSVAPPRNKM